MRNKLLYIGVVSLLGFTVTVNAAILNITSNGAYDPNIDTFKAESGQGVPTGTGGYVDGLLTTDAPSLGFKYLGAGDATSTNEVWFGTNRAAAEAAGDYFINYTYGSLAATSVGKIISLPSVPGDVMFHFVYNLTHISGGLTYTLDNGGVNPGQGAYLVNASLSTSPFAGPSQLAYVGLADRAYPTGDNDFQDLSFSVQAVPEPETYGMFLAGLGLVGFMVRRRKNEQA